MSEHQTTSDPVAAEVPTMLAAFCRSAHVHAGAPLVHYFDGGLAFLQVHERSDALAVVLAADGLGKVERIAVVLQNMPVPINPMYRRRGISEILIDRGTASRSALRR